MTDIPTWFMSVTVIESVSLSVSVPCRTTTYFTVINASYFIDERTVVDSLQQRKFTVVRRN